MDYNIWNKEDSIFENFAKDLVNYTKTGKLPESGDQDVHYYMELQGKRLKKGVSICRMTLLQEGI